MTSLPPLSLDDLTYEDLRQMAVRRIPAASGGRWSLHAPVDAGITLLELFAFLLEQQLFVLDQVPDSLTLAILSLLGEEPRQTGIARTVTAPLVGTLIQSTHVAAGTAIRPVDTSLSGLVFSTRDASLLLPVVGQEIFADGVSVSERLERSEAPLVMATHGAPGSIMVELTLAQAIRATDIGERVVLAVILDGTEVLPEWDAEAVDAPPPSALRLDWHIPGSEGTFDDWYDGTGGLRRSGLVSFVLPAEAVGAEQMRLTLSTETASHAAPPRLAAIATGAMIVEHCDRIEIVDHDTGDAGHDKLRADLVASIQTLLPISGQTFDLPAELSPAIGASLSLRLADTSGTFRAWQLVPDLSQRTSDERAFTFERQIGRLHFGDGYTGRVPAPVTNISLTIELGGGPEGDHSDGLVWRFRDTKADIRLVSLTTARGGAEPETMEEARARIAGSLAERYRAVTAEDYVTLTENAPGIGPHRAHVVAGHDPTFPCLHIADSVTVFVVPRTEAEVPAPRADDGALQVIRERLDLARMLTTRVFVRRPVFRPVALLFEIASVTGEPEFLADWLRPALSAYLHPAIGGPSGTGWPFGRPLRPSELFRVAEAVLPSGARVQRVAIQLSDSGETEEDCTELVIGSAELVQLERLIVRVRRDASPEPTL